MPKYQRELLGLPTIPLTAVKPVVAAMLGSLGWVLGPASPSMQAANERAAAFDETPGLT